MREAVSACETRVSEILTFVNFLPDSFNLTDTHFLLNCTGLTLQGFFLPKNEGFIHSTTASKLLSILSSDVIRI